jgi:hypothetical protein
MMNELTLVSSTEGASVVAVDAGAFVKSPAFAVLPQRTGTRGLLLSVVCHALAAMGIAWLPFLFPAPHVLAENFSELTLASRQQPLILPAFSQRTATETRNLDSGKSSSSDHHPQRRDYAGPQEIVSVIPHATNRVQTILRPDLNAPPDLKFPLRLQSMVKMPAPAAPVLESPPAEKPALHPVAPIAKAPIDVPIAEATVPIPKLVTQPAHADATSPADGKVPRTKAAEIAPLPDLPEPKTAIVVNAVEAPDSDTRIPDAQLAGSFSVGPTVAPAPEKPEVSPAGVAAQSGPAKNDGLQLQPLKDNRAVADTSKEANVGSISAVGREITPAHESVPRSDESDHSNTGGQVRISISGGVPDRSRSAAGKTATRSYGMTITAGGSSGGASRDMGVFNRGETVYSVAIPMTDAGGGPDWPMQYARLNAAGPEPGLLSPPFAQKKVGAVALKNELVAQPEIVFVSGVIDEHGSLQSLRTLHGPDRWSQLAIRALQQWEFLPAQLDGRPVPSKVLIGVTVVPAKE